MLYGCLFDILENCFYLFTRITDILKSQQNDF